MQLMPETAQEYGVRDPFSPQQSIEVARATCALLRRYNGDRPLAAAAYNAGIGAVTRYKGVPPYAETLAYVDKVMALYATAKRWASAPRCRRASGGAGVCRCSAAAAEHRLGSTKAAQREVEVLTRS
jgi:hypothetical protein